MKEDLFVREASLKDAKIIYDLSNDEIVRANSINQNSIDWDNHAKWLKAQIDKNDYLILLFFKDLKFVGQVKFEIKDNFAIVSISICKDFRGKKLSLPILHMAEKYLKNKFGSILGEIHAYISPTNSPSIKLFIKAGYFFQENEIINNKEFCKYIKEL